MAGINDDERAIGPNTRLIARSSVPDGGMLSGGASKTSGYWTPETQPHEVVFPNTFADYKFDFRPTLANSKRGAVEGHGITSGHNGTYEILRNEAEAFQMYVRLGTSKNPTEDMDATLSISGKEARVTGKLMGKNADPAGGEVTGSGTESKPFRVKFPQQTLYWYLL